MKMKTNKTPMVMTACLLVATMSLVQPLTAADTPPASDWEVASGNSGDSVQVLSSGMGGVTLIFPAQGEGSTTPSPLVCDLLIGGSDPANMFTGDVREYSGFRFKIHGDGHLPNEAKLIIFQRFPKYNRLWTHSGIDVSPVPGEWVISEIPLVMEKGWGTTFVTSRYTKEQLWAMDIENVHALVLRLKPVGMDAQTYSISDFRLVGPGVISEPATLSPLQAYFGVQSVDELTAEMLKLDSDGDGMSDYHEILAGLNPYDASSVLAARVAVATTANTISWEGVLGATYGVMRSNNLLEGFELIESGRKASYTGETLTFNDIDTDRAKPYYYKVVKY